MLLFPKEQHGPFNTLKTFNYYGSDLDIDLSVDGDNPPALANPELPRYDFFPNACRFSSFASFVGLDHGGLAQHSTGDLANAHPDSRSASSWEPDDKKRAHLCNDASLSCGVGIDTTLPATAATTSRQRKRYPRLCRGQRRHRFQESRPISAAPKFLCAGAWEFGYAAQEFRWLHLPLPSLVPGIPWLTPEALFPKKTFSSPYFLLSSLLCIVFLKTLAS